MSVYRQYVSLVLAMIFWIAAASAQQAPARGGAVTRSVRFNVVVTNASGVCVTDLQQRDFTVFDDNSVDPITSFRAGVVSPAGQKSPHFVYARAQTYGCFEQGGLFRYEIIYNLPRNARRDEYRRVGIKVDRPNLAIETSQGYFARF